MIQYAKELSITASIAISSMAMMTFPALADSITNPTLGGTAPTDVKLYCADGGLTFECNAPLSDLLQGDSSAPGGNVELAASSEQAGFDFNQFTSLSGSLEGHTITLSSLTASDWENGFTDTWLGAALEANGLGGIDTTSKTLLSNLFVNYGGRQRFSDPNIAYVNAEDGSVKIGLAGHLNATSLFTASIDKFLADSSVSQDQKILASGLKSQLQTQTIQASELVKVSYNGQTNILYSFVATPSGLVSQDPTQSHTGNYEMVFQTDGNTSIPEPSMVLGSAIVLSGMLTRKYKFLKKEFRGSGVYK